jgi:hypothetical protein
MSLDEQPFPMKLYSLLECCQPFYNILKRHALRPTPSESIHPPLPVAANKELLIWVDGQLVPREDAKVNTEQRLLLLFLF